MDSVNWLLRFHSRGYVGITTSPHWRAIGCASHENMVPHFDHYDRMFVLTVECGIACMHLEEYVIDHYRDSGGSKLDNAAVYRSGPINTRAHCFLYLVVKD